MTPIPAVKAAIAAFLLVVAAPATGRSDAKPKTALVPISPAALQAILNQPGAQGAVEHLPKSYLAWNFATERDGTQVISGPGGVIWHGQINLVTGPYTPALQGAVKGRPPAFVLPKSPPHR